MSASKKKILFVCIGNACRSQMAEGFFRQLAKGEVQVFSAGSHPAGFVAPQAVAVMKEKGIDISGHHSKSVKEIGEKSFDLLVTMGCGDDCPWVPAKQRVDWVIPDPIGESDEFFRGVRDEIEAKVRELLNGSDGF
jgi:protein-tyrosine-phosphatase